ncbi:MAG: molybdopterin molybdotransferase MoeA [Afipia felis]|nr:molybdopterin molybdotransferase MoeA [Afipia felis]
MNLHRSIFQQDISDCTKGQSLLPLRRAREICLSGIEPIRDTVSVRLSDAASRIAGADIMTDASLPRFDNSAMDGFGICSDDLSTPFPKTLQVAGRALAGHSATASCTPGSALRILTGAHVPSDVAAVIPQEQVTIADDTILISSAPNRGANIRRRGEDILAGSLVLPKGTLIDARHIAMLAAIGARRIQVLRPLRVGVISTGDELLDDNRELGPAGIIDVNRPMLRALMASPMLDVSDLGICRDDPKCLSRILRDAAQRIDLLLSSGGISGSETDCLHHAVVQADGTYERLRVAMRPGKPIARGRIGAMDIIGLPGNPISALLNYFLFGRPALLAKLDAEPPRFVSLKARCPEGLPRRFNRSEFLPVRIDGTTKYGEPIVSKLGNGSSSSLSPFIAADGFILVEAGTGMVDPGELLEFYPFKNAFAI